MIKHVIWDLDGTLFETIPAITNSILASLADQGFHPKPEMVRELAKISASHCIAILAETYRISATEIIEGFNHHYGKIPYFEQPLKPGALDLCSFIHHSLSGLNLVITHRERQSTSELFEYHGLSPLISDLITGDQGYPKKPDPTSMLAIIDRNRLQGFDILAIGDRKIDVLTGQAAGARTCILGHSDSSIQPDFEVESLYEVLEMIQLQIIES